MQQNAALSSSLHTKRIKKTKTYRNVRFSAETIQEAVAKFRALITEPDGGKLREDWNTSGDDEKWRYDTAPEFYTVYRQGADNAWLDCETQGGDLHFRAMIISNRSTTVEVQMKSRGDIESVFEIFETAVSSASVQDVPTVTPITVFVGHGRSSGWRDLKDHLQDQHHYKVEAYESGARAGHTIRDILDDMLRKSSFALIVLSAEDEAKDGKMLARQNVVHELGLFQGRLGFSRAIAVMEETTEEFSNIHGIQQIRYSQGRIREVFGDVVATLKREFGGHAA